MSKILNVSESTKILGIDPGRNGALALWDSSSGVNSLQLWRMPDTPQGVYEVFCQIEADGCCLEKPIYMAQSGTKNVATMAFNYGILYLCLIARGIPFKEVAPKRWKGEYDLGSDKRASLAMASALFPSYKESFKLLKDDGLAEAALLAHYGANKVKFAK